MKTHTIQRLRQTEALGDVCPPVETAVKPTCNTMKTSNLTVKTPESVISPHLKTPSKCAVGQPERKFGQSGASGDSGVAWRIPVMDEDDAHAVAWRVADEHLAHIQAERDGLRTLLREVRREAALVHDELWALIPHTVGLDGAHVRGNMRDLCDRLAVIACQRP
jgi:hypothetical protein